MTAMDWGTFLLGVEVGIWVGMVFMHLFGRKPAESNRSP